MCPLALAIAHRAHLSAMWRMRFSLCRSLSVVVGVCQSISCACRERCYYLRNAICGTQTCNFIVSNPVIYFSNVNKNEEKQKRREKEMHAMRCCVAVGPKHIPFTADELFLVSHISILLQARNLKKKYFMNLLCFN